MKETKLSPQPTQEGLTVASSLTRATLRALLRNRNFVPLWIGQMVSYLGNQFTLIAALSIVSRLAGSNSGPAMAGLGLANALPSIVLGLFGGVLVDRLEHKKVMIVSDVVRGLAIFLVLFVNDDPSRLWSFAVALAITGASSTLFYPARAAALPTIVPRQMLAGANALLEAGFVIALVFGALLAGVLIQRFGATSRKGQAEVVRIAAKGKADAVVLHAQVESDAAVAKAKGDAESTVLLSSANAKALAFINEQLKKNPLLLNWRYIENLVGDIALILMPNQGVVPMIQPTPSGMQTP